MVSFFFTLIKSQESVNERLRGTLKGLKTKAYYFIQSIIHLTSMNCAAVTSQALLRAGHKNYIKYGLCSIKFEYSGIMQCFKCYNVLK